MKQISTKHHNTNCKTIKNMKPFYYIYAIIAIFSVNANANTENKAEEPFGIPLKTSEEELKSRFSSIIDYEEKETGTIYFKQFPKPYMDFNLHFTVQSESYGVCLVANIMDGMNHVQSGRDAILFFNKISNDITSKYQKSSRKESTINMNDNIFSLQSESKLIRSEWKPNSTTIDKIIFSVKFDSKMKRSGLASILFVGKNYTKCKNEINKKRISAL
ncbi:hypothetical protein [Laribacter hongkongensis]|uniref:Secreted protein n=1 Tax=Laribacter hongkongensis TaxID=168471 RepID=A0ABD4SUF1_9NEIS|nr:hypothetical protein [Laribacter hongkongensis]MCG9026404.1 hypothetical protein [Laribacter hongkongensis]MCG9054435.1 hypothetical protein [Laribacter hongkongensis]